MTINSEQDKIYEAPEWLHMYDEGPVYHPVEDALGLTHMTIWRELKHKAVDTVLTEGFEPFEVLHQYDTYDPHCDSPDHTLMSFYVKTVDYTDHFYPLLQEYFSHQRFQQVRLRYHQAGFLNTSLPLTMTFLNPIREVKIEFALDSRFLAIRENDQRKIIRFRWWSKKDNEESPYRWIFDCINLKLEKDFQWLLYLILRNDFTPSDYFFYIYDKYREIPIIERKHEDYKSVYSMENGDTISLWNENHYGHLYKHSYQIESTGIAINDIRIEEFFVPLNTIPPECIQTDESELKVYCLPEYYLSYPHPYKHAYDFPLHLIEHLPIQSYDPPYVILDSSVKNTPFGMYFD